MAGESSGNGAAHASPGQRPEYALSFQPALTGRRNSCLAPSGLGLFLSIELHPVLRADYVPATAMRDSAITKAKPDRRACRRHDNPMPFNDSDPALRDSAFLHTGGKLQVMTERQDNFRKDDDVRWQCGIPVRVNPNN